MDNEKTSLQKKKSRSSEQSPELLEELIEEILSRLPAKSLLRFRCVSTSWRSLIGSKVFIKKHHQNIRKDQTYAHWRTIYNCQKHGLKQCSYEAYWSEPDPSPFDDPKNNHLMKDVFAVVDSCNGVLCILKKPGSFFLWNPTTRISIELPKLELRPTKYGFGWDEGSDAFKVFAVVSDQGQSVGKVYSTNTNSWKTVDHGCLALRNSNGKFACGKIHWLKESGHHIETFDLHSEVFGIMDNPCKPEVGVSMLLCEVIIGGCLGMFCKKNNKTPWSLLVMKQYEVKESWVETWVEKMEERASTSKKFIRRGTAKYFYIESLVSPTYGKK